MATLVQLNDNKSEKVKYSYSNYPFSISKCLLSHYPNFMAPNHWHDDIELIAVTSGKMKYNVNGEILLVQEGEGIVINSGQMHFGFSDTKSECEFVCVLIHPTTLCPTPYFEQDFVQSFIANEKAPFVFLDPHSTWQLSIYKQILAIFQDRTKTIAPLTIMAHFYNIWGSLFENMPTNTGNKAQQNNNLIIVRSMVEFIQKNYKERITLAQIANSGSVGQSKCCKLFATFFSQSPLAYLNHYRLNKSIDLLQTTDMPIIEISLSVGFSNASYYTETFRKWMNISPREYRKKHLNITEFNSIDLT